MITRDTVRAFSLAGAATFSLVTAAEAIDFSSQKHESIFIRANTTITTINETTLLFTLPNTTISPFTVPSGDSDDLFHLSFTAVVELQNSSISVAGLNSDDVLTLQAEAVNNVTGAIFVLHPSGVTAFASSNSNESNAFSWAARLTTGSWSLRIRAQLLDRSPAAAVTARLGKWTMTVTRYD